MLVSVSQCVLGSTCIALFAFAARMEGESRWLWGGASLGVWVLTLYLSGGGILATLVGQAVLYAIMFARLEMRHRKGRPG